MKEMNVKSSTDDFCLLFLKQTLNPLKDQNTYEDYNVAQ